MATDSLPIPRSMPLPCTSTVPAGSHSALRHMCLALAKEMTQTDLKSTFPNGLPVLTRLSWPETMCAR